MVDNDDGFVRWAGEWHPQGVSEASIEFLRVAKSLAVVKRGGLPARVWFSGEPEWVADLLTDETFLRGPHARTAAIRAAFALPLLLGERVTGVMVLFGQQVRQADAEIIRLAPAFGRAMGRLALASTLEGRSEGFFRKLVENLGDVVFVVDMRGAVLYASPRTREIGGVLPEERVGKTPVDFIHQDDLPQVFSALRGLLQDPEGEARVQYRARHKDGSWHPFESVGRLLAEGGAEPTIVVSARDITERQAALEDRAGPSRRAINGHDGAGSHVPLSAQQVRILSLVAQGLTNEQIGKALSLSPNTIKDNLRSGMKKLGVKNRTGAALAAVRQGIIS